MYKAAARAFDIPFERPFDQCYMAYCSRIEDGIGRGVDFEKVVAGANLEAQRAARMEQRRMRSLNGK